MRRVTYLERSSQVNGLFNLLDRYIGRTVVAQEPPTRAADRRQHKYIYVTLNVLKLTSDGRGVSDVE